MSEILIVVGTNRNDSVSGKIAKYYKRLIENEGAQARIIDLKDLPHDFINSALYDNAGKNEAFNPFREAMLNAKKFVLIVPEYNGSFPGVLKAFIDGLQYPDTFSNKKCALVGLSSGIQGAGLALSHLTDILNYCGTHVLALKVKMAFIEKHFSEETLHNAMYKELLESQVRGLISF